MIQNRFAPLTLTAGLAVLLLLTAGFTFHHGWANYDQEKVLTLTGKILEATYENPHGMMRFETKDKTWTVVLAPPSRMERRGLTREMLTAGNTVTVVGYPHKKIADEMRAERVTVGEKTTELR